MVEVLRHTGIRIEELTELSHHSLIQYRLPATGELIPLLQIAPSKTDSRTAAGHQPRTRRRAVSDHRPDPRRRPARRPAGRRPTTQNERVYNPPMPLLFQYRRRLEGPGRLRDARCAATSTTRSPPPGSPTAAASRCATPSTTSAGCSSPTRSCTACRRTSPSSSPGTATSTPPWATRPSTPRRSSTATGRSSPAAVPCGPARNTAPRPTRNGTEFLGHFERRKVALGDCGRSYATPCIHEHSCLSELILVRILVGSMPGCNRGSRGRILVACDIRACRGVYARPIRAGG